MSSMRCSSCGHRIILPTSSTVCPNCGIPIMPFPSPGSSSPAPVPVALGAPAAPPPGGTFSPGGSYSPVGTHSPQQGPTANTTPLHSIVPQTPGRYATRMPSRPPELTGKVIGVQNLQETERSDRADLDLLLLKQVWNIIWPVHDPNYGGVREVHTAITSVRLQVADGSQREVRIRGDLRRGSVSLGDTISSWGKLKKGTLLVKRAYNHTTDAEIVSKYTSDMRQLIGWFILIAILMFVLVLTQVFHYNLLPHLPFKK